MKIENSHSVSTHNPYQGDKEHTVFSISHAYHRPDDDDDAIKDVIRIPQVFKEAKGSELQDHLQCEHAGEDDVTDLQDIGQLLRLGGNIKTKLEE